MWILWRRYCCCCSVDDNKFKGDGWSFRRTWIPTGRAPVRGHTRVHGTSVDAPARPWSGRQAASSQRVWSWNGCTNAWSAARRRRSSLIIKIRVLMRLDATRSLPACGWSTRQPGRRRWHRARRSCAPVQRRPGLPRAALLLRVGFRSAASNGCHFVRCDGFRNGSLLYLWAPRRALVAWQNHARIWIEHAAASLILFL